MNYEGHEKLRADVAALANAIGKNEETTCTEPVNN